MHPGTLILVLDPLIKQADVISRNSEQFHDLIANFTFLL